MDAPTTHPSLLLRIRDLEDAEAWGEFVEIYTPMVYGFCRSRGLQDQDAADVAQDVLRAIASVIPRFQYDRQHGLFRSWLLKVVRSKLYNFFHERQRQPQGSGKTTAQEILEAQPNQEEEGAWEQEYRQRLFDWAAEQVRNEFTETTWKAFWQNGVDAVPAKVVAGNLGISVGAVYIAKSRVLSRFRERIQDVTDQ